MSHGTHPLIAGTFLAVVAAGAGLGIESAIEAGRDQVHREAEERYAAEVEKGVNLGRVGRVAEAEEVFRALVARHPEDTAVRYNLALALLAQKDAAGAEKELEEIHRLDPQDYDVTRQIAAIRVAQGRNDEALTLLESIPLGKAQLGSTELFEPRWAPIANDPRMAALREKHAPIGNLKHPDPQETP